MLSYSSKQKRARRPCVDSGLGCTLFAPKQWCTVLSWTSWCRDRWENSKVTTVSKFKHSKGINRVSPYGAKLLLCCVPGFGRREASCTYSTGTVLAGGDIPHQTSAICCWCGRLLLMSRTNVDMFLSIKDGLSSCKQDVWRSKTLVAASWWRQST